MLAIPFNGIIGAPLATSLMQIDALGFKSWQWLFIVEGVPSILLGIGSTALHDRSTEQGTLANRRARDWLERTLLRERASGAVHSSISPWRALIEPRVIALCVIYIGVGMISYGIGYFLPQVIKGIGLSVLATGFVSAIPAMSVRSEWLSSAGIRTARPTGAGAAALPCWSRRLAWLGWDRSARPGGCLSQHR